MTMRNLWIRWTVLGSVAVFTVGANAGLTIGTQVPRTAIWMGAHVVSAEAARAMPALPAKTAWSGVVYLNPEKLASLEQAAANVSDPNSPDYHRFWGKTKISRLLLPDSSELSSVRQALRQEGFRVAGTTGLGLGIRVVGTVGLVNRVWSAGLRRSASGGGEETHSVLLSGVLAESVAYISDIASGSYQQSSLVAAPQAKKRLRFEVATASKNITVSVEGPKSVPSGQNILVSVTAVNPSTHFPLKGWNISANPDPNAVLSSYQVSDLNGNLSLNKSGSDVLVLTSSSPYRGAWHIAVASGGTTYTATISGLSWTGPTVVSNDISPQQVNTAYDADALVAAARSAGGMRIGIFSDSAPTLSDLTTYENRYHLPQSVVNIVPVDGGETKSISGWHGELMLDMERSVSSAPGATLDLYTVPPSGSITDAVAEAVSQDVDQVFSMSAVEPEDTVTAHHLSVWNALMAEGTLEGMTFVAGSGDSGPYGDPGSSQPDANWPASSDWVTGVGGTQLGLNPSTDSIQSQWAWSPDGLWDNQIDGSGGGYSKIQAVPAWQKGIIPANATGRGVPDVAFLATSPYYATVDNGVWEGMAGTSASTPTWGGWVADLSVLDGRQGFMNPTLYAMYASNPSAFLPVTHGGNAIYQAGPGWNALTGLGSVVIDTFWQDEKIAKLQATAAHDAVPAGHLLTISVQLRNSRGKAAAVAGVSVKLATPGDDIAIDGEPGGLGAIASTNAKGIASFRLTSRIAGQFRLALSADADGRTLSSTSLGVRWTPTRKLLLPFSYRVGSGPLSADEVATALFPTGVTSHTAIIAADPVLIPKLDMDSVALAKVTHSPILFADSKGALSSATLQTLLKLGINRVTLVGNLSRAGLGLPANISVQTRIWSSSSADNFLALTEETWAHVKLRTLVLVEARAPEITQIAAAALAAHRGAALLMVAPGKVDTATLHAIDSAKTVLTVGAISLPNSMRGRATAIIGASDVSTVIQVDREDHTGPNNLVAFNEGDLTNASLAVSTAEVAANWPSALVPMSAKAPLAASRAYLAGIAGRRINNLVVVGSTSELAAGAPTTIERDLKLLR